MAETFNVYCDESCHLEHDRCPVMVIGGVWCKTDRVSEISRRVRETKVKHGVSRYFESKWNKVSPAKIEFYTDLVDFFFDETALHFRGVLVSQKDRLDHEFFQQDHDTWYYKMFYVLLKEIINPQACYQVFIDIKDTRSERKRAILESVLRSSRRDPDGHIIRKVQQIRSHESQILQLTDLLIGAVAYHNRRLTTSEAKLAVVRRLQMRSGKTLEETTWLREPKFNLLCWQPKGNPQ